MSNTLVKTTCAYCGVGCGVDVKVETPELIAVSGDEQHPANFGKLCSKGLNLHDTVELEGRLLHPSINGERKTWSAALDHVAQGFNDIIQQHGPNAVAFYVSGQLLTEDYYVANKLMKGFIGSGNIDTNSRLCMSSAVAAYKRSFGADSVPCNYEDLISTDLLVITGSNAAWCHPVLFRRIEQAKAERPNMKIVVIDPRRTASCDIADIHLPLKSGTDTTLFNGLLNYLNEQQCIDHDFIKNHCDDFEPALKAAQQATLTTVANTCELAPELLTDFYALFAKTDKTISFYSMGVNQSSAGTDSANSIINAHLATARIGKPGTGPFSITGQPNAMGGREVGGLANQLAAHMDIANEQHRQIVSEFWGTSKLTKTNGALAVDLFEKIESGQIKAVWIMATNPLVSLPNADQAKRALEKCNMVVISDCIEKTDTTAYANVLLPATGWGEKDGTVTNSERRISRQRPFRAPAGEARHDWWIISQVAQRMGFNNEFAYNTPHDVFLEHIALSAYKNTPEEQSRDFDLSGLKNITTEQYEALNPIQWPINSQNPNGTARLFTDHTFYTHNGKAKFIAITPRQRANITSPQYPLVLNTGRIRDQWHTMTRTGRSSRLHSHMSEPMVYVNPVDAKKYSLTSGALAQLSSQWGTMLARISINDDTRIGDVFVPIHWNRQFATDSRVDALVNPAVDPVSGQPEFKHTPITIKSANFSWFGFAISRTDIDIKTLEQRGIVYVCKIKIDNAWRYEIAAHKAIDFDQLAKSLAPEGLQPAMYTDTSQSRYRYAYVDQQTLTACLFIEADHTLPPRNWLVSLFNIPDKLTKEVRSSLLAAKPKEGGEDCGETICSCFNVGINTITTAIKEKDLKSIDAIGECLKAGTNCGSCKPELKQILAQNMPDKRINTLAKAI